MPPHAPEISRLSAPASGPSTLSPEGRRKFYAFFIFVVMAAAFTFAATDAFEGQFVDAARTCLILVALFGSLFLVRCGLALRHAVRLSLTLVVPVLTWEVAIGSSEGVGFVWFYIVPIATFFLLGEREGAIWAAAVTMISTAALGGLFGSHEYSTELVPRYFVTLSLVSLLAYALERERRLVIDARSTETDSLRTALAQIATLRDLLPICAQCKRVRDDTGFWRQIESYLSQHTAADLEPALCPDCEPATPTLVAPRPSPQSPAPRSTPSDLEQAEERRRRWIFRFEVGVLAPVILAYAVYDLRRGYPIEAASAGVVATALIVGALALSRCRDARPIYRISLGTALACFFFELVIGTPFGLAFPWLYLVAPIAIFFFEPREGTVWISTTFLASIGLILGPLSDTVSTGSMWRFAISFVAVAACNLGVEVSKNRYYRRLLAEREALEQALGRVQTLRGLLPVCPSCKKVRDDHGYWEQIESYVARRARVRFSHGLCPTCAEVLLGEL